MIGRQDIVDALAAVPGITASSAVPDTITPGMAWPVWASTRWLNMTRQGPREYRWRVFVAITNATAEAAADYLDPLIEPVGQALTDVGLTVELVEPVQAPASEKGGTIPLLRFTVRD